jgi:hypothetical protein
MKKITKKDLLPLKGGDETTDPKPIYEWLKK